MADDGHKQGLKQGRLKANACEVDIRAAKTQVALGRLAGLHLTAYKRNNPQEWWIISLNKGWEIGFFDSFLATAEEIRATDV